MNKKPKLIFNKDLWQSERHEHYIVLVFFELMMEPLSTETPFAGKAETVSRGIAGAIVVEFPSCFFPIKIILLNNRLILLFYIHVFDLDTVYTYLYGWESVIASVTHC